MLYKKGEFTSFEKYSIYSTCNFSDQSAPKFRSLLIFFFLNREENFSTSANFVFMLSTCILFPHSLVSSCPDQASTNAIHKTGLKTAAFKLFKSTHVLLRADASPTAWKNTHANSDKALPYLAFVSIKQTNYCSGN